MSKSDSGLKKNSKNILKNHVIVSSMKILVFVYKVLVTISPYLFFAYNVLNVKLSSIKF